MTYTTPRFTIKEEMEERMKPDFSSNQTWDYYTFGGWRDAFRFLADTDDSEFGDDSWFDIDSDGDGNPRIGILREWKETTKPHATAEKEPQSV